MPSMNPGAGNTEVRTERLLLRPMDDDDLDRLVELDGFREVRDVIDPFGEDIPAEPSARREYERRFLRPAGYLAAIELRTERFLGWFQLQPSRDRDVDRVAGGTQTPVPREVEIGYRLRPDAWGRGFATEGAGALLARRCAGPTLSASMPTHL
jgi:RimJ/RimL family protein N-acetyltransferase